MIPGKKLEFAVKVTHKTMTPKDKPRSDKENNKAKRFTFNEIRILSRLRHTNVIRCYGAFENNNVWVAVLEYAKGGHVFDRLKSAQYVSEQVFAYYARQMVDAVCYLHKNKVIHRDLKPENFLVKDKCGDLMKDKLLLSDFGLSKHTEDMKAKSECGTKAFMAPEMFTSKGHEFYTETVDVWSLG
ncbi:kinase-like protein [Fomitiporia mediterranea MF3/22]|uniref:kinase-like protein n=1 Tax=Fomitiporia mediterranea (strain MF3/22) TaxID=694068 RepID=UPI0004407D50|nr:kinase-like protein [Fomitiporia mediterranea MF3/22]EJD04671.1 kinase-like protein [Fomitiporia mediterranea MF3/22]